MATPTPSSSALGVWRLLGNRAQRGPAASGPPGRPGGWAVHSVPMPVHQAAQEASPPSTVTAAAALAEGPVTPQADPACPEGPPRERSAGADGGLVQPRGGARRPRTPSPQSQSVSARGERLGCSHTACVRACVRTRAGVCARWHMHSHVQRCQRACACTRVSFRAVLSQGFFLTRSLLWRLCPLSVSVSTTARDSCPETPRWSLLCPRAAPFTLPSPGPWASPVSSLSSGLTCTSRARRVPLHEPRSPRGPSPQTSSTVS